MTSFVLPDLGEGLQEAEIVAWHVAEGDHVVTDEPLVSVETEKAVVEIPSPRSGYIKRLYGKPHERVKVGAPIVEFDEAPHQDAGTVVGDLGVTPAAASPVTATLAPSATPPVTRRIEVSPAVRTLARQRGVDLTTIAGTGSGGAITRADIERAASAGIPGQRTEEPVELRGVRRTMAIKMAKAHAEVVPATVWDEADIESWWTADADATIRLISSIVAGCAAQPILNSWYDGKAMTLRTIAHIDLGVAVDLEEGLIVPVLRDVATKDVAALRSDLDRLKGAVRTRAVSVAALLNPTITLSNFGMMAGRQAALIVVPPQVAIVGAGKITLHAVPSGAGVAFRHKLPLSLTFDHRIVTGGEAGRFLRAMIDDLQKET